MSGLNTCVPVGSTTCGRRGDLETTRGQSDVYTRRLAVRSPCGIVVKWTTPQMHMLGSARVKEGGETASGRSPIVFGPACARLFPARSKVRRECAARRARWRSDCAEQHRRLYNPVSPGVAITSVGPGIHSHSANASLSTHRQTNPAWASRRRAPAGASPDMRRRAFGPT